MTRILAADDDFTVGMQMEEMLTALGYDVVGQAGSGQEAIEMARDLRPDIILMDIVMPGEVNGINAAKRIKAEWDIPIVFISGHGESDYIQEAKQIEPYGYVMKPFDENEIKAFVEIALHKHKMEKQLKQAHEQLERTNRHLLREIKERQEKQEFSNFLLNSSPNPVVLIGPDSAVQYVNPAFESLMGFSSSEIIGAKAPYPWWTSDTSHEGRSDFLEAVFKGPRKIEERLHTKSGDIVWIETNSVPVVKDGERAYVLVNGMDITDRKRAQNELKEKEEQLRTITDTALDAIFCKDTKHRYTFVNPSMIQLMGCTEADLIGKVSEEVFNKEVGGTIHALNERALKGEKVNELLSLPICGQSHTFHNILVPLHDSGGNITGISGIARDITDLMQIQEMLRESEEKHRLLFESAGDAIFIHDSEGRMLAINPMACEMLGYAHAELMSMTVANVDTLEEAQHAPDRIARLMEQGHLVFQTVHQHKDGSPIPIEVSARRITWEGQPATMSICRDITARKTAEKEREQLRDQLTQAQKMEAIGTLAAGVAHDFNNILAIILGNTELTMADIPESNLARRRLDEVRKACLRAKDVIGQILTFSRKSESEQKPIDLASVVTESLKLLRVSIPKNVDIRQNFPSDMYNILGDSNQIHQIMINLCVNAAHAMEDEGGILEVTIENRMIDENIASHYPELHSGPYVQLIVSDTGDGISPKLINRIFDPYFTTKDGDKGTGLGLSVVKGIINSHRGRISVESETGRGTTFKILFPALKDHRL